MVLVLAICETCPPGEIDQVIPVLLNIFDTRVSLMNLMKTLVDREIARTGMLLAVFFSPRCPLI